MANKIKHGEEAVKRGLEVIDRVYGPGYHKTMEPLTDFPYVNETVGNLFADVGVRAALQTGRYPIRTGRSASALVVGSLESQQKVVAGLRVHRQRGAVPSHPDAGQSARAGPADGDEHRHGAEARQLRNRNERQVVSASPQRSCPSPGAER